MYMYIVKMTLSLLLYRIDLVDVARTTHKWLASTTTSIDSEDAKLVEEVRLRTRHRLMSFMCFVHVVRAVCKTCTVENVSDVIIHRYTSVMRCLFNFCLNYQSNDT